MTAPLMYGTKEMKLEPENWTLEDVVSILKSGNPVVVSLEPGDATNYTLLLVSPACIGINQELYRFGIPSREAKHYLFISRLDNELCRGCFVHDHLPLGPYDVEYLSPNEWSQTFLAWWLTELWKKIKE